MTESIGIGPLQQHLQKKQVNTHLPVYSKGILSVNHTRFHREKSLGSPLDSIKKHCQRHNGPTDMIFVQSFTQPDFKAKSFTSQKCEIFLAS